MRRGVVPSALVEKLCLPRVRAPALLPVAHPQALPMHSLQALGLTYRGHAIGEQQPAPDNMVPGDLPADPSQARPLGHGIKTSTRSELQHRLNAQAQVDAGHWSATTRIIILGRGTVVAEGARKATKTTLYSSKVGNIPGLGRGVEGRGQRPVAVHTFVVSRQF